jgi:hypothetical protein
MSLADASARTAGLPPTRETRRDVADGPAAAMAAVEAMASPERGPGPEARRRPG